MTEKERELQRKAMEEIKKHEDTVKSDPFRLTYHLMPPVGLLNDPNGWIKWNGTYHMFFQWNPFKTAHGAKFWGHYTSTDLVHWKEEPIALAPSEWYEKNGCYSGSAVDHEGTLKLIYTGNVKGEQGERESYQCIATSTDGVTFTKEGPVIDTLPEGYTAHFRDPKVWHDGNEWLLVIGAQTEDEKGLVLLYRSQDMKTWEFAGPVAGAGIGSIDEFGYMWECPDLFHLEGKDVLVVSPQGLEPEGMKYHNTYQAGYLIGELDSKTPIFHHGLFEELDRGFEFYAPQTTEDDQGRRILVGWMGVPDQDEHLHPTRENEWIHSLTLPRELHIRADRVIQKPVEELKALRKNEVSHRNVVVNKDETAYEGVFGKSLELQLSNFENLEGTFEVSLRGSARMVYDTEAQVFTFERISFATRLVEKRQCHLESLNSVRTYVDSSSVEIFINDGQEVFTSRFFPSPENEEITFRASTDTTVTIQKWDMKQVTE
ncbi:sucrose-6-phosphate hydrolase [Bacillus shivajii]|uniref:glycoside hydrolase family 32 protein n=1 Tax=Bacillus shivajii TaxID=1983719 RepID=UPI001CFC0EC6|nr:sucrose-6-phosphate hydrolase [Bacillus shivajii]UCZ53097.1 sucrose-6-phosphate hydrolase [Bacillus shivajii]